MRRPQPAEPAPTLPDEPRAGDFLVRAQVDINPQRSDRIGFVRISSGVSRTLGSSLVECYRRALQIGAKSSEICAWTAGMTACTLSSDSTEHLLMMTISVIDTSSGGTGKNTDRPANLIFTTS